MSNIWYYNRRDIDTTRWDSCIDSADNTLIYAKSVYLDCMCYQWGAFILGDYEAVMPIPFKRKYGIRYVYQPPFCQQLGIFGNAITSTLVNIFLKELTKRFRFAEITLNFDNSIEQATTRINYCLDLATSYHELQQAYKPSLKNHVRKAESYRLKYEHASDLSAFIYDFTTSIKLREAGIRAQDLQRFQALCEKLGSEGYIIRTVTDPTGEVCSGGLLLMDSKRLYNILSITSEQGRKMRSNHFLLSNIIKEFAGSGKWLDFEGSMLPGVKVFFESFGTFNQPYFFYRHNDLPFPFKFFRK